MAKAGSSPEATITLLIGRPRVAVAKRSIAAAIAYGSDPEILVLRSPWGAGTSPTRISCVPAAMPEPVGASSDRASLVADGSDPLPESSSGARRGGAIRAEAARAACQLPVGASTTACGWVPLPTEGNTASATPAASDTGSAPATAADLM